MGVAGCGSAVTGHTHALAYSAESMVGRTDQIRSPTPRCCKIAMLTFVSRVHPLSFRGLVTTIPGMQSITHTIVAVRHLIKSSDTRPAQTAITRAWDARVRDRMRTITRDIGALPPVSVETKSRVTSSRAKRTGSRVIERFDRRPKVSCLRTHIRLNKGKIRNSLVIAIGYWTIFKGGENE